MTDGTWTLLSCQYLLFRVRVYFWVENCETAYGPVPTGFGSAKAAGLETFCQMCCGTIYVPPMRNKLAYSGWLKVSTAVVGLGAVALTVAGGGGQRRVLLQQVEGERHVPGGHRLAVAELHAFADRESEGLAAVGPLVR